MKTLYITDLDGTLFRKTGEPSAFTVETLNTLIAKGMHFSFATARTGISALKIMEHVDCRLPVVLMNGVLVYDPLAKRHLRVASLHRTAAERVVQILQKHHAASFVYTLQEEQLMTYYENLDDKAMRDFCMERRKKFGKTYLRVDSFAEILDQTVIYIALLSQYDRLSPVAEELKKDPEIGFAFYRDVYSEDLWYLEIFSKDATKYTAVQFLRETCGFDRIVGFGDNLNDLPLFRACDEKYAVANAHETLCGEADAVIGSNEEDGVANFLLESFPVKAESLIS